MSGTVTILLWAAVLSCGVMTGIYFCFSTFVMRAFNNLDARSAVTAMNRINHEITRSWFMPLFFGSTVVSLLLVFVGMWQWGQGWAVWLCLAGGIYVLGMFVCTALFNVPLNNRLASVSLESDAAHVWDLYMRHWTAWNHLRTGTSLATSILCLWMLTA